MAYLNRATLIGNAGKDPEVRNVQGGAKVAQFTLATTEKYKDRNGEQKENTEWHNIVTWNKAAEFAEKYVKKGSSLYVEGKIRTRSYEINGEKKYLTEIIADRIQLLERREDRPAQSLQAEPMRGHSDPASFTDDNDDIPF